jgi:hypothetical protein
MFVSNEYGKVLINKTALGKNIIMDYLNSCPDGAEIPSWLPQRGQAGLNSLGPALELHGCEDGKRG